MTKNETKEKLASEVKALVKFAGCFFPTPSDFFQMLSSENFDKVDIMIIDSAFKGLPICNYDKTLLLLQDDFINRLYEICNRLVSIIETLPIKSGDFSAI